MSQSVVLFLALLCYASAQTGLTDEDKEAILAAHNMHRGSVIPSASNMLRMVWSDELAQVAQDFSEQCVFEFNIDRVSQQSTFTSVGENVGASVSAVADYTELIQNWFDERQSFDYIDNSCSAVCGSYTQLVWASSAAVGCGAFRCSDLQGLGQPNALFLVCNYGPSGNFIGQLPYANGSSCSACPEEFGFCVDPLCSLHSSANTGVPSVLVITALLAAALKLSF